VRKNSADIVDAERAKELKAVASRKTAPASKTAWDHESAGDAATPAAKRKSVKKK